MTNINQGQQALKSLSLLMACVLSAIFSIWFWGALANTTSASYLFMLCGLLFELTKIIALPMFLTFWRQRIIVKSLISGVMYMLLSAVSVIAGVTVLEKTVTAANNQALEQNQSYIQLGKAIELQQQAIENLNTIAREDALKGYRERAKSSLQSVAKEQERLADLQKQQSLLKLGAFSKADTANVNGAKETQLFFLVLGSLLEITTGYLLYMCSFKNTLSSTNNVPPGTKKRAPMNATNVLQNVRFFTKPEHKNVPGTENCAQSGTNCAPNVNNTSTKGQCAHSSQEHKVNFSKIVPIFEHKNQRAQQEAQIKMLAEQVAVLDDFEPNVRYLKNTLSIGNSKARLILVYLSGSGKIQQVGKRYKCC